MDPTARSLLVDGFIMTLKLVGISAPLTVVVAVALAAARVSARRSLRAAALVLTDLLRSVPLLALLVVVYFTVAPLVSSVVSVFWIAAVVLSVNQAAYLAEVYRGAISQVSLAQWESGASMGLSRQSCLMLVIAPQAIPAAVPATVNAVIYLVKDSALASLISVNELTAEVQQDISTTFKPLLYLLVALVLYLIINIPLAYLGRWLEHRLAALLGVTAAPQPARVWKSLRVSPEYTDAST